jgi:hypothetical protein
VSFNTVYRLNKTRQQLLIGRQQVAIFVQVADDILRCLAKSGRDAERTELPGEMVGKGIRLGEEVLKGRFFALLEAVRGPEAGVEVVLEVGPEIDLREGVFFLFWCLDGSGDLFHRPIPLRLASLHVVEEGNALLDLIEDRILRHLGLDHLLQLQLIQRQHADHLHEARGQYLSLSHFEAQLGLKKCHCHQSIGRYLLIAYRAGGAGCINSFCSRHRR